MEKGVQGLGYPEAQETVIPFRDWPPGDWDGWPPIFTSQYAMYHGAVSYTIEIPLQVNNAAYDQLPVEELRRRSAINTDVSESTMRTTLDYVQDNRVALVDNQIEMFRRGEAGETQRFIPDGFVPGFGPEDRFTTEFPRAYVIPAGSTQRSACRGGAAGGPAGRPRHRVEQATRGFSWVDAPTRPARTWSTCTRPSAAWSTPCWRPARTSRRTRRRCTTSPAGATACCGAPRWTS